MLSGIVTDSQLSTNIPRLNLANAFSNGSNVFVGSFTGSGVGLTNISTTALSGTIACSQLGTNIPFLSQANNFSNPGNNFVGTFTGNGAGLTNLPAGILSGVVTDSQLSTNVPLLNQANNFGNPSNTFAGTYIGNGAGLTNVPVTALSGTIATSQLGSNVALLNQANNFSNPGNTFAGTYAGTFTGNGAALTNLPVSALTGLITSTQLSPNVALVNQVNNFSNPSNNFMGVHNGTHNGTFIGNGAGLTNVPATGLTGTIATSQLASNVALVNLANNFSNPGNTFTGSFSGNGAGLTNLGASSLTGTVPLGALGNAITNWGANLVVTNLGTGKSVVINNGQVLINGFPALTNSLHTTGTPTVTPNVSGENIRIINNLGDQYMTLVFWFTNSPSPTPGTKIFTLNFANPYASPPCLGYTSGLSSDGTFDGGMRPTLFVWGVGPTNATMYISSAAQGATPVTGKYYTNYITLSGQ